MNTQNRRDFLVSSVALLAGPVAVSAAVDAKCRSSLKAFCRMYRPDVFTGPWTGHHNKIIEGLEWVILGTTDSRGYRCPSYGIDTLPNCGKTSLMVAACEWAAMYGHRKSILLVTSQNHIGTELLGKMKSRKEFPRYQSLITTAGLFRAKDVAWQVQPDLLLIDDAYAADDFSAERRMLPKCDATVMCFTLSPDNLQRYYDSVKRKAAQESLMVQT